MNKKMNHLQHLHHALGCLVWEHNVFLSNKADRIYRKENPSENEVYFLRDQVEEYLDNAEIDYEL